MFLSIPGHIVALVNNGQLQVISATGDQFKKVASYSVAENSTYSTWAPPVLVEGGILIKDNHTLKLWSLSGAGAGTR